MSKLLLLLLTTILSTGCSFIKEQLGLDKQHYNPPKQESTGKQEEAMPSNPSHS